MATIEKIVTDWYKHSAPVITDRTHATNAAPVRVICEELGAVRVDQLTKRRVETFRNKLLGRGLSKVTVARYLSCLRAALADTKLDIPFGKLVSELKREPTIIDCWTHEEREKIIVSAYEHASSELYAFICTLFFTGCRRGEALALSREDCFFDGVGGYIRFQRSLGLDGSIRKGTKWGGSRTTPLSPRLAMVLETHERHTSGLLFPNLNQNTVGRNFKRIIRLAEVREFKLHCTRHTAISQALAHGLTLRRASEIFGVSQRVLEAHYAHHVKGEIDMGWTE